MANKKKRKDMLRLRKRNTSAHKRELVEAIRKFDAPILREVCDAVQTDDDLSFVYRMKATLVATNNGIGLAAPQVGFKKRAIVYRENHKTAVVDIMVNPEIVERSERKIKVSEGCLSYPGFSAVVDRHETIKVKYLDMNRKERTKSYKKMEAVIIQHELDHLDGICQVGDVWAKQGPSFDHKIIDKSDRKIFSLSVDIPVEVKSE